MRTTLLFLLSICIFFGANGQENPGEYMSTLAANYDQINKDTWDYVKQISRGKNANKVEKKRVDLSQTLRTAKYEAAKVKPYEGDNSLKQAYVNYLNFTYLMINNNYRQIVDLERISEESYDAMEAYLRTKEEVSNKMDSVGEVLNDAQTTFATKYNVTLLKDDSRVSRKLNTYGKLNNYYNDLYLLFYKSYFYESQMMNAYNTGNIGDLEQYRQTLEMVSKEGLESIKEVKSYHGDESLKKACSDMLTFYYGEAVRYMPDQIEFFALQDRMNTAVKNFQSKKKPSQQEVDTYNKTVNEYNSSLGKFNETNEYLNHHRTDRHEKWNGAIEDFYDSNL